jgi:hypothetical protein
MDDADQEYAVLEDGAEYALLCSNAQQSVFRLRNKSEASCALIENDDALRFQADYQALKSGNPDWDADKILAQLWDHGGYGWLAEQEGEP